MYPPIRSRKDLCGEWIVARDTISETHINLGGEYLIAKLNE
jgi:hypothetical protein